MSRMGALLASPRTVTVGHRAGLLLVFVHGSDDFQTTASHKEALGVCIFVIMCSQRRALLPCDTGHFVPRMKVTRSSAERVLMTVIGVKEPNALSYGEGNPSVVVCRHQLMCSMLPRWGSLAAQLPAPSNPRHPTDPIDQTNTLGG